VEAVCDWVVSPGWKLRRRVTEDQLNSVAVSADRKSNDDDKEAPSGGQPENVDDVRSQSAQGNKTSARRSDIFTSRRRTLARRLPCLSVWLCVCHVDVLCPKRLSRLSCSPELSMGWVDPWVGLGWVEIFQFLVGWIGLGRLQQKY